MVTWAYRVMNFLVIGSLTWHHRFLCYGGLTVIYGVTVDCRAIDNLICGCDMYCLVIVSVASGGSMHNLVIVIYSFCSHHELCQHAL